MLSTAKKFTFILWFIFTCYIHQCQKIGPKTELLLNTFVRETKNLSSNFFGSAIRLPCLCKSKPGLKFELHVINEDE